jgi:putative ABC transport system permease protein
MNVQQYRVALFLATRSVQKGNRFTFLLTIAIIGLVFVNLVFLPSIISGVIMNFNAQSIDYTYGNLVIEPREGESLITGVSSLVRQLDQIPEIRGISPRISQGATFSYRGKEISGSIIAFSPKKDPEVTKIHERVGDGEYLSEGDEDLILLGIQLAGYMDSRKDKVESLGGVLVGDIVEARFTNGVSKNLQVKGIVETGSYSADRSAFITLHEMERISGSADQATSILIRMRENGREEEYKYRLMSFGVQEKIRTYQEKAQGFVSDAIRSFEIINGISTAVSLVIAIVVIFIVIFINTVNKRRQIGILKAIGIDKRVIIYSYIFQVLLIAACGSVLGLALSSVIVTYLTYSPLVFPGGPVYPVVEPWPIIRSVVSLMVVSVISGFVPSYKTANEPILDAIRG